MCRPCDVGIACSKDRLASGSHARSRAFPPLAALAASVKSASKPKPSPRKEKTLTPTNGKREEVKPQPVSAPEARTEAPSRKPGRPRKDSSSPALTYSFEVVSGAEYKARFKSVKYADPASLELLRVAVDKLKPGDRMIVTPKPGESLDSLRNKLCRTRNNYFANAAFKVIVSQDTANKHVALWRKG